jgi:hypothetical protein
MEPEISRHASLRMAQRGISHDFISSILDNANIERPANDNCRLYRVSADLAHALGDDRIGRFAVIWSDDYGQVVTVLPIWQGRAGASYRKRR